MRWDSERQDGSHTEKAMAGTATKWYFAEGSQGSFFTYLLLANPNSTANVATVDWLLEGAAPVQRTYNSAAQLAHHDCRRRRLGALWPLLRHRRHLQHPGVGGTHHGLRHASRPALQGRTQFRRSSTARRPAGSWPKGRPVPLRNVRAARQPERKARVVAELKFLPQSGAAVTRSVTIPARGRRTVNIEDLSPAAPSLANAAVATQVTAPLPIIVERAQYWPYAPDQRDEAHNSAGVTAPARRWGWRRGAWAIRPVSHRRAT